MASTLRVGLQVTDAKQVSKDLRDLGDDLDGPLRYVLAEGAATIADLARGFMRHGQPSWLTSSAARLYGSVPGAIASYYDSRVNKLSANVGSRHPAAPVWEYGGTIHPRSGKGGHAMIRKHPHLGIGVQAIVIPGLHSVERAGDTAQEGIVQNVQDTISALIERYDF